MIKIRKHKYYEVDWNQEKTTLEITIYYVIINLWLWRLQFEFETNRGRQGRIKRLNRNRRIQNSEFKGNTPTNRGPA